MAVERAVSRGRPASGVAIQRGGGSIERSERRPLPKSLRFLVFLLFAGLGFAWSGFDFDDALRTGRDLYARAEREVRSIFADSRPARTANPPPGPRVASTPSGPPRTTSPPAPTSPQVALPPAPPPPRPANPNPDILLVRPPGTVPAIAPFPLADVRRYAAEAIAAVEARPPVGPSATPLPAAKAREIAAAARIGYARARGLIAQAFPLSPQLREAVQPADAVRYALDPVAHGSVVPRDPARDFNALAAHFRNERREREFAELVFDAMRDDERLRSRKAVADIVRLYNDAERGCGSLRRHIGLVEAARGEGTDACGADLLLLLPSRVATAGPKGAEESGFREGMLLLASSLGVPGLPPAPTAPPPSPPPPRPTPPAATAPPPPLPLTSPLIARPGNTVEPPLTVSEAAIDAHAARLAGELGAAGNAEARRAAFEKLNAAAAIGHRRIRSALVGFYRGQPALREVVGAPDIVRYALDSLAVDAIWLEDSQRQFVQLGGFFETEKKSRAFAEAVFDAARDDARLRTKDKAHELMRTLFGIEGACTELRRRLDTPETGAAPTGQCGDDLREALLRLAAERGPAGHEKKAFEAAAKRLTADIEAGR